MLLSASQRALAGSPENAAAAAVAYDEGEKLMGLGQIAEACRSFDESYKLDPQLGVLLHLADCREQNGQLASAWLAFRDAAEWAERVHDDRAEVARDCADELEPRMSTLTLVLPRDLPSGAMVRRNGSVVPASSLSNPLPVDAGDYEIEVSAPGFVTYLAKVTVRQEGEHAEVKVPRLLADSPRVTVRSQVGAPAQPSLLGAKWPAFAALGVGVAGGGLGIATMIVALDSKHAADAQCGLGTHYCEINGVEQRSYALQMADFATVGAIVAGVGLAGAGVLWFVLPAPAAPHSAKGMSSEVVLGFLPNGVQARGRF